MPSDPPEWPPRLASGLQPLLDDGVRVPGDLRRPEIDAPPRRTSPLTLVPVTVGAVVALVLIVPRMMLSNAVDPEASQAGDSTGGLVIMVGGLIIWMVMSAIVWYMRTYTVGSNELTIDQGVISRQRRVIPYGRIQQVDINQSLLERVLGLATIVVDTAGSAGGSAKLGLLEVALARGIRAYALERRAQIQEGVAQGTSAVTSGSSPNSGISAHVAAGWPGAVTSGHASPDTVSGARPERTLIRLDIGQLVAAGLTHHWVLGTAGLVLPVAMAVAAFNVVGHGPFTVLVVVAIALVAAVLASGAIAMVALAQYLIGQYGYTLAEADDDLHVRFGALQVQNLTIPRRRVQHISVVDNPIRRAFGLVSVEFHSAAATGGRQAKNGSSRFEIPIVRRADLDALLAAAMGGDWRAGELDRRPATAKRRAITRRVVVCGLVAVVPMVAFPPWSLLFAVLALAGVPWGSAAHRRAGFAERTDVVVLAHGVVRHHVELVPYSRIQSAFTVSSPFQRLAGLRTLHLNVAGRSRNVGPNLYDMGDADALALARELPRRSTPNGVPLGPRGLRPHSSVPRSGVEQPAMPSAPATGENRPPQFQ